jgi:hypothetical protein
MNLVNNKFGIGTSSQKLRKDNVPHIALGNFLPSRWIIAAWNTITVATTIGRLAATIMMSETGR